MRKFLFLALTLSAIPLWSATEVHHFGAVLSPSNENPAVTDRSAVGEASIGIRVERNDAGDITDAIVDFDLEIYLGQAEELIALHIHRGAAGVNGPIVISSGGLDFNTDPVAADAGDARIYRQRVANMDPAVLEAIEALLANPGGYYVNLHSTAKRPGLIRGQLLASDAALISMAADQGAATADSIDALTEMAMRIRTTVNSIARRLGLVPAE